MYVYLHQKNNTFPLVMQSINPNTKNTLKSTQFIPYSLWEPYLKGIHTGRIHLAAQGLYTRIAQRTFPNPPCLDLDMLCRRYLSFFLSLVGLVAATHSIDLKSVAYVPVIALSASITLPAAVVVMSCVYNI